MEFNGICVFVLLIGLSHAVTIDSYVANPYYDFRITPLAHATSLGYAFTDLRTISGSVTSSTSTHDDWPQEEVNLKFVFPFYGQAYNHLLINPNGYLSFDPKQCEARPFCAWDSKSAYTSYIAPLMTDWSPNESQDATIQYYTDLTSTPRRFIVQWSNMPLFTGRQQPLAHTPVDTGFTFQTILAENGDVAFNYNTYPYSPSSQQFENSSFPVIMGMANTAVLLDNGIPRSESYTTWSVNTTTVRNAVTRADSIVFAARPTCLTINNCSGCAESRFSYITCGWCPDLGLCGDAMGGGHELYAITTNCFNPPSNSLTTSGQCAAYYSSDDKPTGAIVGGVIGVVIVVAVVCGCFIHFRGRRSKGVDGATTTTSPREKKKKPIYVTAAAINADGTISGSTGTPNGHPANGGDHTLTHSTISPKDDSSPISIEPMSQTNGGAVNNTGPGMNAMTNAILAAISGNGEEEEEEEDDPENSTKRIDSISPQPQPPLSDQQQHAVPPMVELQTLGLVPRSSTTLLAAAAAAAAAGDDQQAEHSQSVSVRRHDSSSQLINETVGDERVRSSSRSVSEAITFVPVSSVAPVSTDHTSVTVSPRNTVDDDDDESSTWQTVKP